MNKKYLCQNPLFFLVVMIEQLILLRFTLNNDKLDEDIVQESVLYDNIMLNR